VDEALIDNKQSRQTKTLLKPGLDYRVPTFAGRAYPADSNELSQYLEHYLDIGANQFEAKQSLLPNKAIRGLLSPHIDYPRGGPVYGAVWQHTAPVLESADLVILFGTDHYGVDPFTLTQQHYASPYGILPTATDVVDKLAIAIEQVGGSGTAYKSEFRHRKEHSLELVAVWLHHMLARQGHIAEQNRPPCELVPILCGGIHRHILDDSDPADDPLLNNVLNVLHEVSKKRNVLIVASGDLAHVGPAFSGAPLDKQKRALLRSTDDALLESMCTGGSQSFFEEIRSVRDRNNVCGVTPIYLTMRLLEMLNHNDSVFDKLIGSSVAYDTCPADEMDTSVVTIGGVLFS